MSSPPKNPDHPDQGGVDPAELQAYFVRSGRYKSASAITNGRGWRGFHHHATLCIAAYGFLVAERSAFPPSAAHNPTPLKSSKIPASFRPRGSANPA